MKLSKLSQSYLSSKKISLIKVPPKILQFGTGILLRGLPDYFIHNANQHNVFNGSVVVVKSTINGSIDDFKIQNNLFTHFISGIKNGEKIQNYFINQCIYEVLEAQKDWHKILEYATTDSIEIIISNVTEKGLAIENNDNISTTPNSYPAKLVSILYTRWKHFKGAENKGLIILPTELISKNGTLLKQLVLELALKHKLTPEFIEWIQHSNEFCNTLVDRIVTSFKPLKNALDYSDSLQINSEPFALWAIEIHNKKNIKKLTFTEVNQEIIITQNIEKYTELKLRILNATHTIMCGICLIANIESVYQALQNNKIKTLFINLIFKEIIPCITYQSTISVVEAEDFAHKIMERFSNPFSEHQWESISFNFEEKMKNRVCYLIEKYIKIYNKFPKIMGLGFAS
ncbi:MAG: tagaturonate reductase, partial [Sediminibacterium sp.]|nr:tagaturonate reductase [Sediminibacterium sp.]